MHGLNGHKIKSWTSDNGKLWLRDFLPERIPNVRVFTYGYDANTHSAEGTSIQYIQDFARSLVSELDLKRRLTQTEGRPIIFVAHSLGGLVVKSVRQLSTCNGTYTGAY